MARLSRSTKADSSASWRQLEFRKFLKAFTHAYAGIRYTWRNEPNFRIEVCFAIFALGLAWWLNVSAVPIILITALVLTLELLNSALEATIDLISPDFHPLAKLAKDAAAGAVLLSACLSVILGLVVLGPPLLIKLGLL